MTSFTYSSSLIQRLLRPLVTLALLLVLLTDGWSQISVTYTASGTFVVPSGVTEITVECWGAGGRGGTRSSNGAGGGGGGGAYSMSVLQGVSGSYTVTVGAGSSSTAAGGDSWFGTASTVMAKGGQSAADNSTTGATGGQASAGFGDVTRNGGNGRTTGNGDGGGGGSSAGPGAPGVTATSDAGATAPTGGGNGGAGQTGTNANGGAGSDPGGGGGGATRTSGTKTGGTGGDGQVIVTFYVEGICMGTATSNAIPDAACLNNIRIPISGLNTTMGTGAGQVRLTSVELIANHGRNQDLDITLTSPGGTTRGLISDNFNNGTNIGNPASCPGAPLVIQDGATTLPTSTVNNAVGPYAPDATLAGFTGNPNGDWVLSICDDAAGATTGNLRYVKLNFCTVPTTPAITSNSPVCAGTNLTLGATSTGATGFTWAGTGTYSPNNTTASVSVSGAATGTYTVTATNSCGSAQNTAAVVVNPSPTSVTANASSTSVCSNANTINLTSTGLATGVVALTENFNAGTNSWTLTNTSTGGTPANAAFTLRANNYNWNGSANVTFNSNDASQFYLTNSDAQGTGANTATALTSPAFNTTGMTAATINFYHVFRQQNNGNDRGYVEASTNGSSWTTLTTYTTTQGTSGAFVSGTSTLTAGFLNQPTVYIRFRYTSPYGWYWGIDNVSVSGTGLPSFAWTSTPSGYSSSLQNPTGVAVTQNTVYTVTATGPNGCTTSASTASVTYVPIVTPSVSAAITTGTNPTCSGTSITFTATPTNGGTTPTYQWTKNGTNISGATNVTYTGTAGTAFVNGDLIRVVMTSNANCASPTTATSTAITMTVNPIVTPSVTTAITTGTNPVCSGTSVTFTATPTNGGATPTYQWTKNGTNISGATNVTYTGTAGTAFVNGDLIRVVMTSNAPCPSPATGTSTAINMTVVQPPTTANAGSNLGTCVSSGSATMAANTASTGTGAWSQVSGPVTATIVTPASPTSVINGMTTAGSYVFRWTISNNPCTASTSDVTVTSSALPTSANAGSTQTICTSSGSVTMAANNPSVGTGAWTQISGPVTASITTPSANNTGITGLTTAGSYVFRWTITNGSCAASTSNVTITANAAPTTANAGSNQSICTSVGTAVMAANAASVGTGSWSQVSGPSTASIVSASSPTTTINGLTTAGVYTFRWTISNNPCTASTSDMTVTVVGVPTTANAGTTQTICANPGSVTMAGNTPVTGTGTWSQVSGPVSGTIVSPGAPNTVINGLTTAGNYVFRWRITSNPCTASNSNVTITVAPVPTTADAGLDQDVCVSPGLTTMAANSPVVGFGAWTQESGPTTASIVDSSDPLTDISGFNQVGAYVFRWTITGSGCPPSYDEVTVNVFGSPTTANAGADQPICSTTGDAIMAGNAPSVGVGQWSQVSGPVTATIVDDSDHNTLISNISTVGTYTFRWSISNGPCSTTQDDVVITSGPCAYYSRGSGDFSDPIWSDTPNGTADLATFSAITDIFIQNGDVITNTSNTDIGDLNLEVGGTLVLNGATTLNVHGNAVDVDGTLNAADNSTVAIVGSSAATLSTTGSPSFYDLTLDNAAGVTLSGSAVVRNTLSLEDGAFDAGTAQLTLPSTATYTGRLGPVAATASYVGDLTMQRYISAGRTNWRMMGSPVSGSTVNSWKDDYITAGFPGSHYPTFDNPVGSGILWPSIRWYNETNTGSTVMDGLVGATGASQSLAAGQGFATWCGSGFSTTTAFTVDVTGNPNVASSPITLPMSYTNTGDIVVDGWNMVSNPLPSPIAFDQISRGTDVEDFIVYFDPATGNNATYDISSGLGTNNGSNVIQSSQAFWLKANGSGVTTTVDEADKINDQDGGFFGGSQVQTTDMVRLRINSGINQFSDETVVVFNTGAPGADGDDVPKFTFAHPDAPQIATQVEGASYTINAYGPYSTDIIIPVLVDVAINGTYTITATGLAQSGLTCLKLEDLATNTITPLVEGTAYSFAALASDDATEARFVIHASAPLQLIATDATCNGRDDGEASVDLTSAADVIWRDAGGVVMLEQNNASGATGIVALEAGEYTVEITSNAGCGALSTMFTIDEPGALEATAIAEPTSCPASEDGTIDVEVLGGVAPYTFEWNNNANGEHVDVAAGTYTVLITDANGCTMAPQEYLVSAGEGPLADISLESGTVMVDEDVLFVGASSEGVTHTWDFGDGNTSTELEPVHSFNAPGTYTITLTVDDGTCTNTTSLELVVETSTGLPTIVGSTINAYVSGDFIVVDHNFSNSDPVIIRVFSTGGQLAQEHRVAAAPARITLPTAELATGIWLVRVSNGNNAKTFSLPILH